jgi:dinuclear metal center YbgI/SA1388 family protein
VSQSHAALSEVVTYLDQYLRPREIPDDPNALNGLQVENSGKITRFGAAVDASLATLEGLPTGSPGTLLVVHHGLFWDGNQPVSGRRYRKVKALIERDAALYGSHIPLDLHPDVGNNAVLARRLGLASTESFGLHKGVAIGVAGTAPEELNRREGLVGVLSHVLGISTGDIKVIAGGPDSIRRIGIITGGAGSAIAQAHAAGCDTYITGEGAHHTYFEAMELGVNVLYAGHYATETIGVQALVEHLSDRYHLPWEFHHHPTGL